MIITTTNTIHIRSTIYTKRLCPSRDRQQCDDGAAAGAPPWHGEVGHGLSVSADAMIFFSIPGCAYIGTEKA